jgi:hypothetical protein
MGIDGSEVLEDAGEEGERSSSIGRGNFLNEMIDVRSKYVHR